MNRIWAGEATAKQVCGLLLALGSVVNINEGRCSILWEAKVLLRESGVKDSAINRWQASKVTHVHWLAPVMTVVIKDIAESFYSLCEQKPSPPTIWCYSLKIET